MNILSLFDGMSCGRIAAERAGINVGKYYASEIDKYAIIVTQANYPDTIQLGKIENWREWNIDWSSIDLILAGSPCQGFSYLGKGLAFDDPRSKLFFIAIDILNHIKSVNPAVQFLFENVRMKEEYRDIMSEYLTVEPIRINSALLSAQNRVRDYWANWQFGQPEDKGVILDDIFELNMTIPNSDTWHIWWEKNSKFQLKKKYSCIMNDNLKSITMTARQVASWTGNFYRIDEDLFRFITPIECERLQTVPDGYTAYVSNTQRYKMLGNGWNIDTIVHILKGE